MIVRNCAGGIVFCGDKVLLICNDKHEWSFPKGVLRESERIKLSELAVQRVEAEAGVASRVLAPCGKTNYEFYSVTRRKPAHNNISWFVMCSAEDAAKANPEQGIAMASFETVEKALETITYSQDKSLLMMAYQKYRELV